SGRDLDCAVIAEAMPQLEPALKTRPPRRHGRCVFGRDSVAALAGLIQGELRPQASLLSKSKTLLEPRLRLPQPQVSCAGQGRNAHLGQRVGVALRDQRLVLRDREGRVLPAKVDIGGAQTEQLIQRRPGSRVKIHECRSADLAAAGELRTLELQSEDG